MKKKKTYVFPQMPSPWPAARPAAAEPQGDDAALRRLAPEHNGLWFRPTDLTDFVDAAIYETGLALYRNQKVLELTINPGMDEDDPPWTVVGQVQGQRSTPYLVYVDVSLDPDSNLIEWDPFCECPKHVHCEHAVALSLKVAYKGRQLIARKPDGAFLLAGYAPIPTAQEDPAVERQRREQQELLERQAAERVLLDWLRQVNFARQSHQARQRVTEPEEFFVYLLRVGHAFGEPPRLWLEAMVTKRKKNGDWGKPRPVSSRGSASAQGTETASELDRELQELLMALHHPASHYYTLPVPSAVLQGRAGVLALEMASQTARLHLNAGSNLIGPALRLGAPRQATLRWTETPAQKDGEPTWTLQPALVAPEGQTGDGGVLCLNDPLLYLDVERGECGLVQASGLPRTVLQQALRSPPLRASVLRANKARVIEQLGGLPLPPVLDIDNTLSGIVPRPCLQLRLTPRDHVLAEGLIRADLQFEYEHIRGWWAGLGSSVVVNTPQGEVLLQRDPDAEFESISQLLLLGLRNVHDNRFCLLGPDGEQVWLDWFDDDFAVLREAGFAIEVGAELEHWLRTADQFEIGLTPQGAGGDGAHADWFDLSLGLEVGGVRYNILHQLPGLIERLGHHTDNTDPLDMPTHLLVAAPDGHGYVRVPTEPLRPWVSALLELASGQYASGKLSRMDALRTSAALGEGVVWKGAEALRETVRALAGAQTLPAVEPPAGLQATLRPYQLQGLQWLQFLRQCGLNGVLADDMGLGKTLQTLAHVLLEKEAGRLTLPAMIVAPLSLLGNWRREAQRFTPELRTLVLHGKERHEVAATMAEHDLVIVPYSLLYRDRQRWIEQQWHLVVLDEAQNIKNASSNAAQTASELPTRHRLCLSGTPMENHLGELWSLFHFLMPGFLGSQARFRELFRTPIEKQGQGERMDQLRRRITPFLLRRTKADVASELPEKVVSISSIELQGKQADLYETVRLATEKAVREALTSKGLAGSQIHILDALLKLRQVCCDPRLVALPSARKVRESAKLEYLMDILPQMIEEGRRVLLFSQFTSMLELIEIALQEKGLTWTKLTGQSRKREEVIERFTSGAVPIFLISLKAGGVGLNLPQADTVIHYDPWWNPAVENQATDRAHRIGQQNQVFVYKLVAQGTIEERILALQDRKAELANTMYSAAQGRKQALFTETDVEELLKPLGSPGR